MSKTFTIEIDEVLADEIIKCDCVCHSESIGGNISPLIDKIYETFPHLLPNYLKDRYEKN